MSESIWTQAYKKSLSGSTSSASGSTGDPLATGQSNLDQRLQAILNSDAPMEAKVSALKLAKGGQSNDSNPISSLLNGGGNLLGKALEGLDLGRSAVENTVLTATQAVKNAVEPGSYTGGTDLATMLQRIKEHKSGASYLDENALTHDAPGLAKGVGGFVADVGFDPLTYLGGSGALEEMSGRQLGNAAFDAAKVADNPELATKLQEIGQRGIKGAGALKQEDRAILGEAIGKDLSGGVAVKNPLHVLGIGGAEKQLIPGSDALSAIPRAFRGAEESLRAGKVGQTAAKYLSGDEAIHALTDTARRGADPQAAADAFQSIDATRTGMARAGAAKEVASKSYKALVKEAEQAGVSTSDMYEALGAFDGNNLEAALKNPSVAALQEKAPGLLEKLRAHDNLIHDLKQEAGLNTAFRDLHVPNGVTDEFKAMMGGGTDAVGMPKDPFLAGADDIKAKVVPGEDFMGHTLAHPTQDMTVTLEDGTTKVIPADPEARSPMAQAQAIADKVADKNSVPIFNQDWVANAKRQLRSTGRRLEAGHIEQGLLSKGIAKDLYEAVPTPESIAKVAEHQNATEVAQSLDELGRSNSRYSAEQAVVAPERVAALDPAVADAATQLEASQGRMGALQDLQAQDAERLAKTGEVADQRLAKVNEIADLSRQHTELAKVAEDLKAGHGMPMTPERAAQVEQLRTALGAEGEKLQAARLHMEELRAAAERNPSLGADIADHGKALDAMQARQEAGQRLLNAADPQTGPALERTHAQMADIQAKLQELGKDSQAKYMGEMAAKLPNPSSEGVLTWTNGAGEVSDRYIHGTAGTLNIPTFEGGQNFGTLDNFVGAPHFLPDSVSGGDEALKYSTDPMKLNPDVAAKARSTQGRIAEVRLHVENPLMLPGENAVERMASGSYDPIHEFHPVETAIADKAINDGVITADTLFQHIDGENALKAGIDQGFVEDWAVAEDMMGTGVPHDVALNRAFANGPHVGDVPEWRYNEILPATEFATYDELLNGVRNPETGAWEITPHTEAEADAAIRDVSAEVKAKAGQSMPDELKKQMGADWANEVQAQGYDSVMYPHDPRTGWAVVPLDPNAIESKGAQYTKNANGEWKIPQSKRTVDVPVGPNGQVRPKLVGRSNAVIFDMKSAHDARVGWLKTDMVDRAAMSKITQALPGALDAQSTAVRDASKLLKTLQGEQTAEAARGIQMLTEGRQYITSARSKLYEAAAMQAKGLDPQAVTDLFNQAAEHHALGSAMNLEAGADYMKRMIEATDSLRSTSKSYLKSLGNPAIEHKVQQVVIDGFAQLGISTQGPAHIVSAMQDFMKLADPAERGIFLKGFDKLTSVFKAYAILTPGFHVRNMLGGTFNNWLAGVELAEYSRFARADRAYTQALGAGLEHADALLKVSAADRSVYEQALNGGLLSQRGQATSLAHEAGTHDASAVGEILNGGGGKVDETALQRASRVTTDNPATRANYLASEKVERMLRGTLAMDTIRKGGSIDDAVANVAKYHFDYGDLSKFEKGVMKRVNPFYTWTRKNLPLQLEMLFKQPDKYVRYYQMKNNLEAVAGPADSIVPSYFGEQLGIHLPLTSGGQSVYLMPDLPFKDLGKTGWREWASQLNPVIKAPLEAIGGRQWFSDVPFKDGPQPIPSAWNAMGVGAALEAIGMAQRSKDGTLMTGDKTLYSLEQYMPLLGRLRRTLPSEDKYQQRAGTTMVNMLFGTGLRTNTTADQKGELYRRQKGLDAQAQSLSNLQYGGYYQSQRVQATASKTTDPTTGKLKSIPQPSAAARRDPKKMAAYLQKYGAALAQNG